MTLFSAALTFFPNSVARVYRARSAIRLAACLGELMRVRRALGTRLGFGLDGEALRARLGGGLDGTLGLGGDDTLANCTLGDFHLQAPLTFGSDDFGSALPSLVLIFAIDAAPAFAVVTRLPRPEDPPQPNGTPGGRLKPRAIGECCLTPPPTRNRNANAPSGGRDGRGRTTKEDRVMFFQLLVFFV